MSEPGKLRQGCEGADTRGHSTDRHGVRGIHKEACYHQTGDRNRPKTECMAHHPDPLLPAVPEGSGDNGRAPPIEDPGGFRSHEGQLLATGMGVRAPINLLKDAQKRRGRTRRRGGRGE